MILAHRIALDPTIKQQEAFLRACGVARYAWNWALEHWNAEYAETGVTPKANYLRKQWNAAKPEWVYESPKDANQQPFINLGEAWTRYFKGAVRKPRFKKRGEHDSFYVSNDKFRTDRFRVRLPIIGWVRMREELRFTGKIMSATVSRDVNKWFISIAAETDVHREHGSEVIGVDLGVKNALTLSTGEQLEGPKPLKRRLKKLKRLQRAFSRTQKGSRNRRKAARRVALLNRRIRNIRNDFLHKATSTLCARAKRVVIEDLNVKGMLGNHCLARSISDVGFGEFRRQLTYKSIIYANELVVADRWFPSSKLCSRCGTVKTELKLSERTFRCEACGLTMDRDHNAAQNLAQYVPVVGGKLTPVERGGCRKRVRSRPVPLVEAGTRPQLIRAAS